MTGVDLFKLTPLQQEFLRRAADLGVSCQAFATIDDNGQLVRTPDCLSMPWPNGRIVADLCCEPIGTRRDRLTATLTHFHRDLMQADLDARAIDGFNRQLSQSYEEVNFVFRMARLLTSPADPKHVVQAMCDDLRQTLQYGWLGLRFNQDDRVTAALRDSTLHAGALPADASAFTDGCGQDGPAGDGKVLLPGDHPLATLTGGEVLRERILHDDAAIGLLLAGSRQGTDPDVSSNEIQFVEAAANFLGLYHQNAFRFDQQRQQFIGTLNALSASVDAKDPYTRGHSERVGLLGAQLARLLGFDAESADDVREAGLLHDIGKIGVPEAILRKPARLTDDEFAVIKKHPVTGYDILKDLPSLSFHLPGVLHHHERWDGRGYPHGLRGEQIPMIARILAFADTFDAMSSSRAYRKGMDRENVLAEIRKSSGVQFDPSMVETFVGMDFTDFDRMLTEQEAASPPPLVG